MKNPIPAKTLFLSLSVTTLLLSGCATRRPPRRGGPPPEPVMPPMSREQVQELPTPAPVAFIPPVVEINVPPAAATPKAVAPRKGTPYTIRKGESLSAVATRNNISWRRLAEYNYITNPDKVRAGQVILIPPSAKKTMVSVNENTPVAPPPAPANSGDTYVVQSGDSLSVVARRYNTTVANLKSLNGLRSDRLLVGQILKLPAGSKAQAAVASRNTGGFTPRPTPVPTRPIPTPAPVEETLEFSPASNDPSPVSMDTSNDIDVIVNKAFPIVVQEGDTLESIANNYIVPVAEIRKLNKLGPNDQVKVGQKLQIPPSVY